jgi:L-serine dehydratase
MFASVFNDVLGPVMRGPSSSHTAGSYHIARVIRDLLGEEPLEVDITFDANGSYARTYAQQGSDQAFAMGLMGWDLIDPVFHRALDRAAQEGVDIGFHIGELPQADHPNYAIIYARGACRSELTAAAKSVGGGTFLVTQVDGHPVRLDGKSHVLLVECGAENAAELLDTITAAYPTARIESVETATGTLFLYASSPDAVPTGLVRYLREGEKAVTVRCARPVYYVRRGVAPFTSAEGMVACAEQNGWSLGETVLRYEMALLGLSEDEAVGEMLRRYDVMKRSVLDGFVDEKVDMLLLDPVAATVRRSIEGGRVAIGGIHARAAAAAMAAMHTCNSRGVVCAAPTGGAAGTLPGTLTALDEAFDIDRRRMALMLFAAGGVGLILAIRGTFAAEVAGCQVEIGAAGAMASAAVVEFAGGSAREGCDAAAISFQNTMGSVCDLVQGMCELPCHTRNAVAASSAFTNADLILGGYVNPIPLDETIDAVYSSGQLLPSELRCTSLGGLAVAPSAQRLVPRSHPPEA